MASGADVAEDSPRRMEMPLSEGPTEVDPAEIEVCRVLDSTGLRPPYELRLP